MIKIPNKSIEFFKNNIDEIFDSGFLAEGPWNKKISEYIKDVSSATYAIPTSSNGSGLVSLLNIYSYYFKRNKVLIQSNTMYGVKVMVPAGGCELVGFIDCRLESLMPSLDDVKNAICNFSENDKSKLIIMLSHIGGINNPDIIEISQLCKEEDIVLLEDCAHSFGATNENLHSGLFGNAGVYSFYSTKAIPVGEGGMIVTDDSEIGHYCKNYSIYDRFDQKMDIGFNNRISEPQALLAFSVIKEWKNIIHNKIEIARKYANVCDELGIDYISQNNDVLTGNYYKFVIYDSNETIENKFPKLKTKTSCVYDYSIGAPNPLAKHHACLPIWYGQETEITDRVIQELKECY